MSTLPTGLKGTQFPDRYRDGVTSFPEKAAKISRLKREAARNRVKIRFVNFLADNPDWKARWKLMENYWQGEFSERIIQELSGPEGGPIETKGGPYVLEITCTEKMLDWPILDANGNTPQPIEPINGRN